MEPIIDDCKAGKKVYIFDPDGTERSAMIAWYLRFYVKAISINDAFEEVNEAYQMRVNKPAKWANVKVPRFARQRLFCHFEFMGLDLMTFEKLMKAKVFKPSRQNSKKLIVGEVKCGQIVHVDISTHFMDPAIDSYETIRLVKVDKWRKLQFDEIGPVKFESIDFDGETVNDFSRNLTNLMLGISVYPEHVDEEGNVREEFFTMRTDIFRTVEPLRFHPLMKRDTRTREQIPPLFCLWGNLRIPVKMAYVHIASHFYEQNARKLLYYERLVKLRQGGCNLLIIDFAGYDYDENGLDLKEYSQTPTGPWGAAQILVGMLTDVICWNLNALPQLVLAFYKSSMVEGHENGDIIKRSELSCSKEANFLGTSGTKENSLAVFQQSHERPRYI